VAVTLSVKTIIVNTTDDTDAAIATAINSGATYTTIYGVSVLQISNTKAKVIVVYA